MNKRSDYSFGIIPIRFTKRGEPEFLLINHQLGHWGFPKGHAEGEESALQTAYRELKEEVALTVERLLSDTSIIEKYTFEWGGEIINKEVQYWPALVTGEVILQELEVRGSAWLTYERALARFQFKENKETLRLAHSLVLDYAIV